MSEIDNKTDPENRKPPATEKPAKAAPPAQVAAVAEAAPVRALPENRLKVTHSSEADVGNHFAAVTATGTPFEDVLKSEFWAHTAYKLHPGDEIVVHTDNMVYFGRLYVRSVSAPGPNKLNNRATVFCLERHEMDPLSKTAMIQSHEVVFLGPHKKWCVRSLRDQQVVKEGYGTADEAQIWLRSIAA